MIEANWLWQVLFSFGFGGLISGGIVYLICTRWLSSYLNKKGENLATKEDVQAITYLVKGVEHQYNLLVEEMKAKQQLRMAALDKRLQAHQESFALWRKLTSSSGVQSAEIVMECQKWWEENCLYLEPEVREAFAVAYTSFNIRQQMVGARVAGSEIAEVWKEVMAYPNILFKAIKLPTLSPEIQSVVFTDHPNDNNPT